MSVMDILSLSSAL